jgi:SAM-dependent methyltransferase
MKDNFSVQSDQYAKYRPTYPADFFAYLDSLVPVKDCAWDCGTGNGQVAFQLASTYRQVFATDISQSQIDHAIQANNIAYSVQPAEKTHFDDHIFDIIVVAQAIHWFNFEQFYAEVRRTAKPNALICALGYGRIVVSEPINHLITTFYTQVIGPYWDRERRYIDENYQTIPFPFREIKAPSFVNSFQWTLEHLIGYLNTWSAVKHFIKQNGFNPVEQLGVEIGKYWGNDECKKCDFPLLLRIGQVNK